MAPQREDFLVPVRIPDFRAVILTGGGDATALGAERNALDLPIVPEESQVRMAGRGIPEACGMVIAPGDRFKTSVQKVRASCVSVFPCTARPLVWELTSILDVPQSLQAN